MEIATTTEFQLIYPAFVMHKHWAMPEGFNDRLYALAAEDAVANRIQDAGDGRNVGDQTNHLGHLRHNFLMDRQDPAIAVLAQMVAAGVREYLHLAYAQCFMLNLNESSIYAHCEAIHAWFGQCGRRTVRVYAAWKRGAGSR